MLACPEHRLRFQLGPAGTWAPGGSVRHHGSLRPLARVGPTGTLPTDSRAVSGPSTRDTARAWWGRAQGHIRALRHWPPREASWGVGVVQVRPGCVPASVPPSPARPTMKGRGVPGGVCPATLVLHPARPAGRLSAGGGPRLGPAVSLRRVSPGDQGLTGPVRPPGPSSHALE